MTITAIIAADKNGVIGRHNDIPWYLPEDLKYFKRTTLDHPIIMGRKTFKSIGRPLPKRTNIVLTRDPFFIATGCAVVRSIQEGYEVAAATGAAEVFIIGGGGIYAQTIAQWNRLHLTRVDLEVSDGEVFLPEINWEEWRLESEDHRQADDKNAYDYTFQVWNRIKKDK